MFPVLRTSRLVLTPLAEQHLSRFVAVASERAIADTTISVPHPLTELGARAWIDRAVAEAVEGRGAHFAIAIRPDEEGSLAISVFRNALLVSTPSRVNGRPHHGVVGDRRG